MMGCGQEEARDSQVEEILELIHKLLILGLVELLAAVVANKDGPGQSSQEAADAEDGIHGLTAITAHRISEIMELQDAEPDSGQELVSPSLISKVDNPSNHIIHHSSHHRFLLKAQYPFPCCEDNTKPKEVDDVDDENRIELP
jgi:hypothetical protein